MNNVTYSRERHAAHYAYDHRGRGHDLERWDSVQAWNDPRPESIPNRAERTSGYIDRDGKQHVVFTAIAPMSEGTCVYCEKKRK